MILHEGHVVFVYVYQLGIGGCTCTEGKGLFEVFTHSLHATCIIVRYTCKDDPARRAGTNASTSTLIKQSIQSRSCKFNCLAQLLF